MHNDIKLSEVIDDALSLAFEHANDGTDFLKLVDDQISLKSNSTYASDSFINSSATAKFLIEYSSHRLLDDGVHVDTAWLISLQNCRIAQERLHNSKELLKFYSGEILEGSFYYNRAKKVEEMCQLQLDNTEFILSPLLNWSLFYQSQSQGNILMSQGLVYEAIDEYKQAIRYSKEKNDLLLEVSFINLK